MRTSETGGHQNEFESRSLIELKPSLNALVYDQVSFTHTE